MLPGMTSGSLNAPLRHAAKLAEGQKIALDPFHMRALRRREIKEKEAFTIVDREGHFFRASLKVMKKSGGEALVYERMAGSTESPVEITLICAVLARQRMLVVVQKATELGVARIIPVLSERSAIIHSFVLGLLFLFQWLAWNDTSSLKKILCLSLVVCLFNKCKGSFVYVTS